MNGPSLARSFIRKVVSICQEGCSSVPLSLRTRLSFHGRPGHSLQGSSMDMAFARSAFAPGSQVVGRAQLACCCSNTYPGPWLVVLPGAAGLRGSAGQRGARPASLIMNRQPLAPHRLCLSPATSLNVGVSRGWWAGVWLFRRLVGVVGSQQEQLSQQQALEAAPSSCPPRQARLARCWNSAAPQALGQTRVERWPLPPLCQGLLQPHSGNPMPFAPSLACWLARWLGSGSASFLFLAIALESLRPAGTPRILGTALSQAQRDLQGGGWLLSPSGADTPTCRCPSCAPSIASRAGTPRNGWAGRQPAAPAWAPAAASALWPWWPGAWDSCRCRASRVRASPVQSSPG